jgi:DNA-binding NtrC family response regulator
VVLVVEDEPLQRMLAVDLVEDAGFVAIEAENADVAMLTLDHRSDIQAVFTDIDMPGSIDGLKLAACVRDRWPPIEIIVTSGKAARAPAELPMGSVFLPKPYDPGRLTALLREMVRHGG